MYKKNRLHQTGKLLSTPARRAWACSAVRGGLIAAHCQQVLLRATLLKTCVFAPLRPDLCEKRTKNASPFRLPVTPGIAADFPSSLIKCANNRKKIGFKYFLYLFSG